MGRNLLIAVLAVSLISDSVSFAAAETEAALRERVSQYYTALQSSRVLKAAEYVTLDAREDFRTTRPGKFLQFNIRQVEMEPDTKSAKVLVNLKIISPGIARPIDLRKWTRWKVEDGVWYLDPSDPPGPTTDVFQKYFYEKRAERAKNGEPPYPSELAFNRTVVDFGVAVKGSTVSVAFTFVNKFQTELTIEKVYLQEQFMKDVTAQKVVGPGKKGEILLEINTSPLYREIEQDIFVQIEPIQEIVQLKVKGKVFTAEDLKQHHPN